MDNKPIVVDRNDKSVTIIINGQRKRVTEEELSFDELVDLAFDDPRRGPQIVFTISFHNAGGRIESGNLDIGQKLKVKEGTVVDVTRTDLS